MTIFRNTALILVLSAFAGAVVLFAGARPAFEGGDPPWAAVALLILGALALRYGRRSADESFHVPEGKRQGSGSTPARRSENVRVPARASAAWRSAAVVIAFIAMALVLWRLPQLGPLDSYAAVALGWLLSITLYLAAQVPAAAFRWPVRLSAAGRPPAAAALAAITLCALVLRAWRVDAIPFVLGGDEASQGLEASRVLAGELRNPFGTGWLGVPTMSFYFQSIGLSALGRSIAALRLPWVFVGSATIVPVFYLTRRLSNSTLATVAAALLAGYHYHIHFSRLGSNQVADPLFMALALWLLHRSLQRRSRLDWALCGSAAGMGMYFYAGARLTPLLVATLLVYHGLWSRRDFWPRHRSGIAVLTGAFLLAAAPMLQYAMRFTAEFNARINAVGIIQSGWLTREVEILGVSTTAILWDQFQRASMAFNHYPDRTVWYGLQEPLLNPFFGSLFLLGLVCATMQLLDRNRGWRVAPMVVWWWAGMLLGGMLTENPPSSQRLVTLSVPVCFFIAYAAWEITALARQSFRSVAPRPVLAAVTLLFTIYSLHTYFVEYTPLRLYGGGNAALATELAPVLNTLKQNHRIYMVGAPWLYWNFATFPFLVSDAHADDVLEPLPSRQAAESLLPADMGAVFIVIPPRQAELAHLRAAAPHGEVREFVSPVDDRLMGSLYIVPAR